VLPDVYASDASGWQALHVAAHSSNSQLVAALIENGADVNAVTEHGHNPLYLAVLANAEDCAVILVDHGARPDLPTLTEKLTPLHIACRGGNLNVVRYLVDRSPHECLRLVDNMGRSMLHHAAVGGHALIGTYLISRGANPLETDVHGWSARQTAEYYEHRKFEEAMVRAGLTVTQSVIKDLPPAEWQGPLWSDFLDRKTRRQHSDDAKI
jgi:ankyrin repeat protein